jgi:hypothetical protein
MMGDERRRRQFALSIHATVNHTQRNPSCWAGVRPAFYRFLITIESARHRYSKNMPSGQKMVEILQDEVARLTNSRKHAILCEEMLICEGWT